MDTEERHELKENDLAEFFRNFGEWWSKHGNTVLIILIIVLGGITAYRFYSSSTYERHQDAWTDLANATGPEGYVQVARMHDVPAVQTLANLRGADLFRLRAIGRYEPPTSGEQAQTDSEAAAADATAGSDSDSSSPPPSADLEQAAALYQRVLEAEPSQTPTAYRVNALLGLGSVAESRKAWEEAQQHYEKAIDLADDSLPALAQQAMRRRDLLNELQRPIVFATQPAQPTGAMPPTTQPSSFQAPGPIQLNTGDAPLAPTNDDSNTSNESGQ